MRRKKIHVSWTTSNSNLLIPRRRGWEQEKGDYNGKGTQQGQVEDCKSSKRLHCTNEATQRVRRFGEPTTKGAS